MQKNRPFTQYASWDPVLLLLLALPYFLQFGDVVRMVLLLLVAIFLFVSRIRGPSPSTHLVKFTLVALIVAFTTLIPMIGGINLRLRTEGTTNAFITTASMHDGALQTEEALKLFLAGKNPYSADYSNTLVALYPFNIADRNPALTHYVYLPLNFLLAIPFYSAFESILGWYDQRLLFALGFLLVLFLVPLQARNKETRLLLWISLGLNPLITGMAVAGIVDGGNDYLVLSLIMLTAFLLQRGKRNLSAVPLALASGIKHSTWFFLPFYFAILLGEQPGSKSLREAVRPIAIFVGIVAATILPFFLWDPGAFLEDTVYYISGSSATPYPIDGLSFSNILLVAGLIPSRTAYFPFWILELLFGGSVLLVFLKKQLQNNTLPQAWLGYSLFLGTTAFFSRFLNPNYLGYILALFALGLWSDPAPLSRQPERRETVEER